MFHYPAKLSFFIRELKPGPMAQHNSDYLFTFNYRPFLLPEINTGILQFYQKGAGM
jgi:hypothetical protein